MSRHKLSVVGLFAGIGGLEHGLARAGHETRLLCEIDDIASLVLSRRFPGVSMHSDVRQVGRIPPEAELLTAGFPCQDLSQAGRTRGIHGRNSGLVGEVFRLLRRKRVPHVLFENVPNMLQLGKGAAMRHIVEQFEELGYAWAYRVVDSRAFGVAQRRRRVFFLASREIRPESALLEQDAKMRWPNDDFDLDATAYGFYWTEGNRGIGWTKEAVPPLKGGSGYGIPSPPAVWLRKGFDGLPSFVVPSIELAEELHGFRRGWTDLKRSVPGLQRRRWRLVGNAVSVPVAKWLGDRLAVPSSASIAGVPLARSDGWPLAAYGAKGKRFAASVSCAPIAARTRLLSSSIRTRADVAPLSAGAAAGFESRLLKSYLRTPPEFRSALADYCRDGALAAAE